MPDPITFDSTSPRFSLPFLFVAQAQKEFFVNEALARIDALLHLAVEAEQNDPPASPSDGECWIIGTVPTGVWSGHPGEIAMWQGGNWLFAMPQPGMAVFDKAQDMQARYDGGWNRAAAVTTPTGGSVQDAEARSAITGLIAALGAAGILPAS